MFTKERSAATKGIAIAAMLFHHCFFTAKIYSGYFVDFSPFPEYFVNNIATFGKFCVGIFAFISGYGLALKWDHFSKDQKNLSDFFVTRYIHTLSGFWFVFPICCLLFQLIDGRTLTTYFSGTAAENLFGFVSSFLGVSRLMGTPNLIYEWWYMSAAVLFILLVPIFTRMVKSLGFLASALLVMMLPRVFGIEFAGGTQPFSFIMPVLLGIYFYSNNTFDRIHQWISRYSGKFRGQLIPLILGTAGLLIAYWLYRELPFENYWEIKYGVIPVAVIIILNETLLQFRFARRLFLHLGNHSMNMYLIHMFFLTYLKELLFSHRHFLVSWLLLMIFSLLSSYAVELLKKAVGWNRLTSLLLSRVSNMHTPSDASGQL